MNKVLQFGFQSFIINVSKFLVVPLRSLSVCSSIVGLGVGTTTFKKRLMSNTTANSILNIKGKEVKLVAAIDQNCHQMVSAKEVTCTGCSGLWFSCVTDNLMYREVVVNRDEPGIVQDDEKEIEAMTVQELKAALRRLGLPVKGRKQDLISTLRLHVDSKSLDESSSAEKKETTLSIRSESVTIKRNIRNREETTEDDCISSEKKMKVEASSKELKSMTKTGKQQVRSKEEASMTITSEEIISSSSQSEPWTVLAHKKPQKDWKPYNPKTMRPPPPPEGTKHVKIMTWNVNGLRALLKLKSFSALQLAQSENIDVLCLQETKLQAKDVEDIKKTLLDGYDHSFWSCSVSKLGYSGTAIISRIKPVSVRYGTGLSGSDHDLEGRIVTAEFDSFYLISTYVPNSGDGLKRLSYRIEEWDQTLSNYIKELEKSKPVVLTGDLNCAHEEIDIFNPDGNKRSAGFTLEERQSFGKNFLEKGLVDTFRKQHPGVVGYTYWGYRHGGRKRNKGWRLDYFLVSESMAANVHDSYILPHINGSDHCPIGLILNL